MVELPTYTPEMKEVSDPEELGDPEELDVTWEPLEKAKNEESPGKGWSPLETNTPTTDDEEGPTS